MTFKIQIPTSGDITFDCVTNQHYSCSDPGVTCCNTDLCNDPAPYFTTTGPTTTTTPPTTAALTTTAAPTTLGQGGGAGSGSVQLVYNFILILASIIISI